MRPVTSTNNRLATTTASSVLLLFLLCFAPIVVVVAEYDPDAAPALDLSGGWRLLRTENCFEYVGARMIADGEAPDFRSLRKDQDLVNKITIVCTEETDPAYIPASEYNFHDCLKITITDREWLHHMVADGNYVTDDIFFGKITRFQTQIEEPFPQEAEDGATATLVMYEFDPETMERTGGFGGNGNARRYINSEGNMVLRREIFVTDESTGEESRVQGSFIFEKIGPMPGCGGYDPDDCKDRVYTDQPRNWTVACCENQGGYDLIERMMYPNRTIYGGEFALGMVDCDVPP